MRGIVIAKMLVLTLWALYLAIGLTQGAGSDERRASGSTLSSRHLPAPAKAGVAGIHISASSSVCGWINPGDPWNKSKGKQAPG